MIEQHVDITTPDGVMNTFVTYPEEGGPFPVVLFYMDAPGKREELHDMARRLATVGYFVVLPNLYYRQSRDFTMERDEAGFAKMFAMMAHLKIAMVMRDTQAMFDYVDAQPSADRNSLGLVGYCMSGPFVVAAAAKFPQRVRCAASIYGAGLLTDAPDSPHLGLADVKGELYFACAEIDKYAPPAQIEQLEAALEQAGTRYRLDWYPGAEHGFAFPRRKGIYHQASAERHWERLFDLFRRTLQTTMHN